MTDGEYIPLRKASLLVGLQGRTIRNYAKKDIFKTYTSPSGQILYNRQSLLTYINDSSNIKETDEKRFIIYCRVSSKKQSDDLQRQIDLARDLYPSYEVITDIGSGINFKRKGLQTILRYAVEKQISELVVFHKDRLARFGFEVIEQVINLSGGKIKVVGDEVHKSSEQELAEDLLSIITIYSCKQMGKRRYNKNSKTKTLPDGGTEESTSEMV
jgi:putative resolvase